MSQTKDTNAPVGARLKETSDEQLKAEELYRCVTEIIDDTVETSQPVCNCRQCAESGDCYVEISDKVPQKWDESGKRSPTGAPSDLNALKGRIGTRILKMLKRFAEIDTEGG